MVAIRLAKALQAIHQSGILHLDLKPANVLLLPADLIEDWQIRIIDFGLSKLLPQFNTAGHTRTLTGNVSQFITASFEYASPEQKMGLKTTIASDVYSYGKTMFELLGDIGGFDVPKSLQEPLIKCLKIKPEERINLTDLLVALESMRTSSPRRTASPKLKSDEEEKSRLIREREELERQRREHEKKVQEDQARLVKEREKLEQQRREHEKCELERKQREEIERQRTEQERLVKERGIPRTFLTMSAGKQVECTVYEKTFDINGVPLVMVYIPEGIFQMGSNNGYSDEKPVHQVEIKKAFYMGKYPVTQKQYQVIMGTNPSNWKRDNLPVGRISWNKAKEFCEKLSQLLKQEFRLPTEAEWEYACRADSSTKWSFGDNESDLKDYAWYNANSDRKTHDVGQKKENGFGLFDMYGNVWEWTCDDYKKYIKNNCLEYSDNNDVNKLLRGGSWSVSANNCRSANRYYNAPDVRNSKYGVRVVSVFSL